jgi:hypothetical protein
MRASAFLTGLQLAALAELAVKAQSWLSYHQLGSMWLLHLTVHMLDYQVDNALPACPCLPCLVLVHSDASSGDQMSECALSMLTALAEEVNNMDRGRRRELVSATSSQWGDIAGLARGFIPEQLAAGAALVAQQQRQEASGDARGVTGGGVSRRHEPCIERLHVCMLPICSLCMCILHAAWQWAVRMGGAASAEHGLGQTIQMPQHAAGHRNVDDVQIHPGSSAITSLAVPSCGHCMHELMRFGFCPSARLYT